MDKSRRLDAAVRTVKQMPQAYQERAIIRLTALIREWENAPDQDAEPRGLLRMRQALNRLVKRLVPLPLKIH